MSVKALLRDKGDFVSTVRPGVQIHDVMDLLEPDDVSALVVTDDGKTVLGIISSSDIVRGLKQFGSTVVNSTVEELMTRDVICADVSEPMAEIYQLMDTHQIRYVPILREGVLCGIINILDVVKDRLKETETEADALKRYVAGNG